MELSPNLYVYLAVVTLVYLVFMLWFLSSAKVIQARRITSVLKRKNMDSTVGAAPNATDQEMKEQAVERIESRFSNIRRLVIPFAGLLYIVLLVLPFLNYVPATYISILVGAVGVTVGIAAKPFVENIISGLIMSFGKSIRIGDTIEIDGQYSTVEDISMTYTVLKVWDWKRYIIPNGLILQKEILNYSMYDKSIWAYVEFYVSPEADLSLVEQLALESVKGSKFYDSSNEPSFWVMANSETSIKCWLACWAKNPSEAWELKSDMRKGVSQKLRENGIPTQRIALQNRNTLHTILDQ